MTRVEVRSDFLARCRVEEADGRAYREYRIPAADMRAFNAALVGIIVVTHRFR